jgi:threonine dehydrogenase-like Zn-dependent dehydrogenase
MQIGNGKNEQVVPFQSLAMRQVRLLSSGISTSAHPVREHSQIDLRFNFRYTSTWPVIIRMLAAHRLPGIEDTVTHTFKLEDATEAFRVAGDPTERSVKVQIVDEDL